MFKPFARLALGALLATISTQAMAQAAGWSVSEASGQVFIQRATERVIARRGVAVGVGDTVSTGTNGRAILVHNKDFVTVAPNSRIRIPAEQAGSKFTQFFQDLGNAVFSIEKRGTPHFSVKTPYLAAVVKGTTFSVTVGAADTSLQVTEGLVEVATIDGGARDLVRPGSIALIAASDRYRLNISGDQQRVLDSPARQGGGSPLTPATQPAEGSLLQPASFSIVQTPSASEPASEFTDAAGPLKPAVVEHTIEAAISSKPTDLGSATGGMVSGAPPVLLAALDTREARPESAEAATTANPGRGSEAGKPALSEKPNQRYEAISHSKSEDAATGSDANRPVKDENSGKGNDADKPVKDENPGKGAGNGKNDR